MDHCRHGGRHGRDRRTRVGGQSRAHARGEQSHYELCGLERLDQVDVRHIAEHFAAANAGWSQPAGPPRSEFRALFGRVDLVVGVLGLLVGGLRFLGLLRVRFVRSHLLRVRFFRSHLLRIWFVRSHVFRVRRDLILRSVIELLGRRVGCLRRVMNSITFPVWGSAGVLIVTDPVSLDPARRAVLEVIDEFDRACSRFRPDSELSALNAGDGAPMHVSRLLLDAVDAALRAAALTGGDVDPSIGEALIALGYDRDFASVGPDAPGPGSARDEPLAARPESRIARVAGWRAIELDGQASSVRLPRGVKLDLGATAKALAADRAAGRAADATGCGALVGLGGDIAVAGGAPEDGWRVRVTDDHRAGVAAPGQWIRLRSGGLATSSSTVRRWRAGSEVVHHLLDPATGRPTEGPWRTVSVTAASCLDANIASTAAIVRGERAAPWLESLGLPSRLVSVHGAVVHLAEWPAADDDLPSLEPELAA